jgi:hypothetical protein
LAPKWEMAFISRQPRETARPVIQLSGDIRHVSLPAVDAKVTGGHTELWR